MKNLSQRNKVILALAAIAIVVLAGVVVLQNPPANELLGATSYSITPSNPTIILGRTVTLTENSSYPACNWFVGNSNILSFVGQNSNVSSVTVKGIATGQSPVYANCGSGFGAKQLTTTVTVRPQSTNGNGDGDGLLRP